MPIEVGIWRMDDKPKPLEFEAMDTEKRLEDTIGEDISIIDSNLFLIGRQVPTAYGKFIDLLALDRDGNLVVIELKKNKTPREVVAQVLDYGSWVRNLAEDDVAGIFESYLQKYKPEESEISLDQAFCKAFEVEEMPETLNESHELVVVAAKLDDSTERIINYLTEFGVAVNAVFFRFFKDDDKEYISRAWLIEPDQAEAKVVEKRQKLPWNGEYYVSFGHRQGGRNWEDARKYGFISAGGGEWYSRTLNILERDSRIWVNVPKIGYVGVGIVKDEPTLAKDFIVTDDKGQEIPIIAAPLKGNLLRPPSSPKGSEEYMVRVEWLKTVSLEEAIKEKGFFGNQNSAAKPRAKKWQHTVERLRKRFEIETH